MSALLLRLLTRVRPPGLHGILGCVTDGLWFPGEGQDVPGAEEFLRCLRALAGAALSGRVTPEDTVAYPYEGCLVCVGVPGVPALDRPCARDDLELLFRPGLLGGYWGCRHLWDDFDPRDPEALHVSDDLSPATAAEVGLAWLREQLQRPLVREEWDDRWSGTSTQRWVLTDTGKVVAGRRPRWPRRHADPDRTIVLWPGGDPL
jgi:hypothetical protein